MYLLYINTLWKQCKSQTVSTQSHTYSHTSTNGIYNTRINGGLSVRLCVEMKIELAEWFDVRKKGEEKLFRYFSNTMSCQVAVCISYHFVNNRTVKMRAGIKMRESLQRAPSNHQFQAKQTRAHTHTHTLNSNVYNERQVLISAFNRIETVWCTIYLYVCVTPNKTRSYPRPMHDVPFGSYCVHKNVEQK